MSKEYICTAEFTAKPGMIGKLIEESAKLVPLSRKEEGCLRYEMHSNLERSDVVFFIERFKDKAAFDVHATTPYIRNFVDNVVPVLVKDMKFGAYCDISESI